MKTVRLALLMALAVGAVIYPHVALSQQQWRNLNSCPTLAIDTECQRVSHSGGHVEICFNSAITTHFSDSLVNYILCVYVGNETGRTLSPDSFQLRRVMPDGTPSAQFYPLQPWLYDDYSSTFDLTQPMLPSIKPHDEAFRSFMSFLVPPGVYYLLLDHTAIVKIDTSLPLYEDPECLDDAPAPYAPSSTHPLR